MNLVLFNPFTHQVAAELIPGEEIIIKDECMLNAIKASGISVTREFKKNYNYQGWRVYPSEDKRIFALAFQHVYFIHGLQQRGFYWLDKKAASLTDGELAQIVLANYRKRLLSKTSDDVEKKQKTEKLHSQTDTPLDRPSSETPSSKS